MALCYLFEPLIAVESGVAVHSTHSVDKNVRGTDAVDFRFGAVTLMTSNGAITIASVEPAMLSMRGRWMSCGRAGAMCTTPTHTHTHP